MSNQQNVEPFWQSYLATLPENHLHTYMDVPEAWSFGYGEEMAERLGALVLQGGKTATCCRYLGNNLLEEAGVSIILDGRGEPMCVIDTFEITVKRFRDVDAAWAKAEGEGDLSLEHWRRAHWNFFTAEAKKEGYAVSEDMLLCCERFRVVYSPRE